MQIQMKASPAEEMCVCMGAQAHTDQTAVAVVANLHFPNLSKYNSVFSSHYVFWIGPCERKKKK